MLSDEEKEIFNNLKEYMQSKIDNGYHKFIYNDLGWDFKCIDCINAIDNALKQSKEIERINEILIWKQKHEEQLQKEIEELKREKAKRSWLHIKENGEVEPLFYVNEDKIKAKIEEYKKLINECPMNDEEIFCKECTEKCGFNQTIDVLQSLLEKE